MSFTSGSSNGNTTPTPPQQRQLLLGSYINSHRDAVTQVTFHLWKTSRLLSAGEDGLVNIYNTTKPTEDLAVETVINTGTPIRKAGFCGGANDTCSSSSDIYCLTGSETVSIWDGQTTACIRDDQSVSVRDTLAKIAAVPSTHPLLGRCAMKCPSGCTAIMCTCAVTRPAATWELH